MSRGKEKYEAAKARADSNPVLAVELGIIVFAGMADVEQFEAFAGSGLHNIYHTFFPMPDGQFWRLSLSKMDHADAG